MIPTQGSTGHHGWPRDGPDWAVMIAATIMARNSLASRSSQAISSFGHDFRAQRQSKPVERFPRLLPRNAQFRDVVRLRLAILSFLGVRSD